MKFIHYCIHILLLAANLLLAGALLVADMSVYISPEHFRYPALLGIGFEWLVLANTLMAIVWLFTQRKSWCVLSILVLICSMPSITNTWGIHRAEKNTNAQHHLSIITYNIMGLHNAKPTAKNEELQYIYEQDADVVCLEEFVTKKNKSYLTMDDAKQFFGRKYPYMHTDFLKGGKNHNLGLAIFSKYPLHNKTHIEYDSQSNNSCRCDLHVEGDTIRLIVNHLESHRLSRTDLDFIPDTLSTDALYQKASILAQKLDKGNSHRANEVRAVRQEADASPYPVLLVGDFNDVPVSYAYRTIRGPLRDAYLDTHFLQRGHTFHVHPLMGIRIDYILHSPFLLAEECEVLDVDYSDHKPLRAVFSW